MGIFEEILPAQNRSFELGLKLGLPHHEVVAIHSTYSDPRSRLLHVILAVLNQAEPRPTWRVIVDALRSPAVNLPRLADKMEAAHFPQPTTTRDVVPTMPSTGKIVAKVKRGNSDHCLTAKSPLARATQTRMQCRQTVVA